MSESVQKHFQTKRKFRSKWSISLTYDKMYKRKTKCCNSHKITFNPSQRSMMNILSGYIKIACNYRIPQPTDLSNFVFSRCARSLSETNRMNFELAIFLHTHIVGAFCHRIKIAQMEFFVCLLS